MQAVLGHAHTQLMDTIGNGTPPAPLEFSPLPHLRRNRMVARGDKPNTKKNPMHVPIHL